MFGLCKNRRNELIKEAEADFIISNEITVLPEVTVRENLGDLDIILTTDLKLCDRLLFIDRFSFEMT